MTDAAAGSISKNAAAARRAEADATGPMLAADGRPLKVSLNRALRRQKLRALALIAPLLLFILITFVAPILDMLFRSVENQIVSETLPRTVIALQDWEARDLPSEDTYAALAYDFMEAAERRIHTRLGSRLNYETTGLSSTFRRSGRGVDDIGETYADQFIDLDPAWEEPTTWTALMGHPEWLDAQAAWAAEAEAAGRDFETPEPPFRLVSGIAEVLPETADAYRSFALTIQQEDEDSPTAEEPWNTVYLALYRDLVAQPESAIAAYDGPAAAQLRAAAGAVGGFESVSLQEVFGEIDDEWIDMPIWETIQAFSDPYTAGYFLAAVDLQLTPDGIEAKPENQQIYILLFQRTIFMSLVITISCVLLGYPIAYLLSNLPMRTSNLLLILVLLPFWTSLLVRTSAWKVLLQQEGVINDILVWIGLVADDSRLALINNQTGTIIAMTHILLPFMILPLYSVMKTIPPSYVRAAKSLGATNWTAFWRVYFPQSVPGIGAGCILVFILSIGYYITPELVGGRTGTFISNRIAFHISESLNWGLAAALGSILLAVVLVLYWLYDRMVGIDNVKLG
jgi:putative spermidine/putrescine transport system permease protein